MVLTRPLFLIFINFISFQLAPVLLSRCHIHIVDDLLDYRTLLSLRTTHSTIEHGRRKLTLPPRPRVFFWGGGLTQPLFSFFHQFNIFLLFPVLLCHTCHTHSVGDFLDYRNLSSPELEQLALPQSREGGSQPSHGGGALTGLFFSFFHQLSHSI